MKCQNCGQEVNPKLSLKEYEARAVPRLESIDHLAGKINFATDWKHTPEGERYERLMREQMADEVAAGL